jgi:hypothetical protein
MSLPADFCQPGMLGVGLWMDPLKSMDGMITPKFAGAI